MMLACVNFSQVCKDSLECARELHVAQTIFGCASGRYSKETVWLSRLAVT